MNKQVNNIVVDQKVNWCFSDHTKKETMYEDRNYVCGKGEIKAVF